MLKAFKNLAPLSVVSSTHYAYGLTWLSRHIMTVRVNLEIEFWLNIIRPQVIHSLERSQNKAAMKALKRNQKSQLALWWFIETENLHNTVYLESVVHFKAAVLLNWKKYYLTETIQVRNLFARRYKAWSGVIDLPEFHWPLSSTDLFLAKNHGFRK